MSPLESRLRRLAASLDTSALEALANKGLLRRAQKDLERGIEIHVAGEDQSRLRVQIAEYEVKLSESGPATASCSCSAAGVCQHILTAILFLQKQASETQEAMPRVAAEQEPQASADPELMAITPEQLEKWAGKAGFRDGLKLAGQSMPEIVRERSVRIRFPAMNVEAHYVPGGGLDGVIVSGGKGDGRQVVVAAVIGFQRAQGREWSIPAESSALEASEGSPRTRLEVLAACQSLLNESLINGLSRISSASQQRWATLAVSALGVNLPRLALSLRGIGDETAIVLARDARSDLGRMLTRMAQAHALCAAIQRGGENPRADLVGLHRTRYDEVGNLDLVGAAAWPWRTASGYEGLTLLFWDPSSNRWNSWTESRPRHQLADFKPVSRYTQAGPWEGAESPRQLARSSFRLMNARRNSTGRLSGSSKSRVLVTGPATLRSHRPVVVEDWSRLFERFNAGGAVGLKEANPLDSIIAIKPEHWGERTFDAINQVFLWALSDSQGQALLLELGFDDFTEPAIQLLEKAPVKSLRDAALIGRLQLTDRGITIHPYSVHKGGGEIIHLCLDAAVKAAPPGPNTDPEESAESFEAEEEIDSPPLLSPALTGVLDEIEDALLAIAEAGTASSNLLRVERIRHAALRAERLGFLTIRNGLENVIKNPEALSVLRCAYLLQLHRRAVSRH